MGILGEKHPKIGIFVEKIEKIWIFMGNAQKIGIFLEKNGNFYENKKRKNGNFHGKMVQKLGFWGEKSKKIEISWKNDSQNLDFCGKTLQKLGFWRENAPKIGILGGKLSFLEKEKCEKCDFWDEKNVEIGSFLLGNFGNFEEF